VLVIPPDRLRLCVVLACLLYRLLCGVVRLLARGGGERELEVVVLRHQLAILKRGGKRPRYTTAERALLAAARVVTMNSRYPKGEKELDLRLGSHMHGVLKPDIRPLACGG